MGRDVEEWIVAEAVVASRRGEDPPLPGARADQGHRIVSMTQVHHDAAKTRTAPNLGNSLQGGEKLRVIRSIAGALPRVARREYAGRATQRIYFKARVIRDCGQIAMRCRITRLEDRILDEGQTRLRDGRRLGFELTEDVAGQAGHEPAKLADLRPVVARENDSMH